MQHLIEVTGDGSHTITIPEMGVSYHSKHGAIGESKHVFIEAGLLPLIKTSNENPIKIFEMGFGTGLNALLSLQIAIEKKLPVSYTGIENFPVTKEHYEKINYGEQLQLQKEFLLLHDADWNTTITINEQFSFTKIKESLLNYEGNSHFDCIYFDAFSPETQPELWSCAVFEKLFQLLEKNGVLVTYCSKSIVRKAMQEAGFIIEKIPGPWGKREMVRARKIAGEGKHSII